MSETEKRRDDRLPVIWEGTVTTEDDEKFKCEIRDISQAGALVSIEKGANIAEGTELILEVDGLGHFAGSVRWCGSSAVGLTLIAGTDLELKKFAEKAGVGPSTKPEAPDL